MGSKSNGSAPPAPDPTVVANAQAGANRDTAVATARLNQVNEYSPYGSSVWSPTGQTADGIAGYQRTVSLSPAQQAILNAQNATTQQAYGIGQSQLNQIGDTLSHPLDFSGLPAAPAGNDAYRQQVQDALFARSRSQLDPMYADQQRKLETQLVNEGFARGNEGYDHALDQFGRQRANAYESASQDSIANSGNAAAQQFGLQSSARQNALAEMLQKRNAPINELSALLGTSGGVQTPQFSANPQTNIQPTDTMTPTYAAFNAATQNYNQQRNQNNALAGSIFGAAGTALGGWLSDREAKTDITPVSNDAVLDQVRAMPVSEWSYKGGDPQRHVGPMAQDMAASFGGNPRMIDAPTAFGVSLASIKALADRVDKLQRRNG